MVDILFIHVRIWNIETCWNYFKNGEQGRRENNGMDEPNQDTICVYMEMSPWNPLYNYHINNKNALKYQP
jgi:hypothetical protein